MPWWNVSSGEFLGLPAQITAWMAVAAADVIKLSVYVIPWPGSPPPQRALSPIWAPWINVRQQVQLLEPDNRKEKKSTCEYPTTTSLADGHFSLKELIWLAILCVPFWTELAYAAFVPPAAG